MHVSIMSSLRYRWFHPCNKMHHSFHSPCCSGIYEEMRLCSTTIYSRTIGVKFYIMHQSQLWCRVTWSPAVLFIKVVIARHLLVVCTLKLYSMVLAIVIWSSCGQLLHQFLHQLIHHKPAAKVTTEGSYDWPKVTCNLGDLFLSANKATDVQ